MIKILHLLDTPGPGGAERIFVTLVERLDPSRFKSYAGLIYDGWAAKELRDRKIDPLFISDQAEGPDPLLSLKIFRWVKRLGIDVVHCHLHDMNVYGSFAAFLGRIPAIATHHDTSVSSAQNPLRRSIKLGILRRLPTCHVCVAAQIGQSLIERLGVPKGTVVHIPNGVDRQEFSSSLLCSLRESLSLPRDTFLFGCVANLYKVKGQDILLEAFARVKARSPRVALLVVGRGECESALRSQASELGIEKEVRFLGFRSDARALMHLLDCLVIPSRSEGLPMVLLEAFATGLPVVSTRVGGIPEIIRDGQNGFLVSAEDPTELARRMIEVAQDEAIRHRLAANAESDYGKRWSLDRMVSEYEALYEGIAESGRAFRFRSALLMEVKG